MVRKWESRTTRITPLGLVRLHLSGFLDSSGTAGKEPDSEVETARGARGVIGKSREIIQLQIGKVGVRFRQKPYSTIFLLSISCAGATPIGLALFVMVSLSSAYFLLYFMVFLSMGLFASVFIVPLLTVSFVFASCVVIFGFLSDITFKFAQVIYFKTDHRLKSTLGKMGNHTKGADDARPQVMKNYSSARIKSSHSISQPLSSSSIAKSLEQTGG